MTVTNEELHQVILKWMEGYESIQMLANRIRVRYIAPLEREVSELKAELQQSSEKQL